MSKGRSEDPDASPVDHCMLCTLPIQQFALSVCQFSDTLTGHMQVLVDKWAALKEEDFAHRTQWDPLGMS